MADSTTVSRPCSLRSMPQAADGTQRLPAAALTTLTSERTRTAGFSLIEVLVALVVMGVIAALLAPLIFTARGMVENDQLRTATNQGVRAGSDLMGSDIRMAGERFPRGGSLSLSPIQIVPGGANPDEITLRRNLWEGTLPVCMDPLNNGHQFINVVRLAADAFWTGPYGGTHAECGQTLDSNGWPMNLAAVKALADTTTTNGVLRGYILDPATGVGEFIDFDIPADADDTGLIRLVGMNVVNTYQIDNRPLIYILDERHYRVQNGILELLLNGNTASPLAVAADISDFEALYVLNTGVVSATFPAGTTWRDIESVSITLTGMAGIGPDTVQRSFTNRYFPRNVLSR